MQRIQLLRAFVLALLATFIVIIGLCYRSNSQRQQRKREPVESSIRMNEHPESVADEFIDTQTVAGKVTSTIRAKRTMGFKSGWYTLEQVQLTMFREGGKRYDLFAPEAQFKSDTKEAEVRGGVRVISSDGLEILTQQMHFDGNELTNNVPVHFSIDRWVGQTTGIKVNVQLETVNLLADVSATTPGAKPGDPAMTLTSKIADIYRKTNDIIFHQDVLVTRSLDTLRVDTLSAKTNDAHKKLVSLAGDGNVVVHVARGSILGGRKPLDDEGTILADGFFGNFDADGVVHDLLMVSKTLAHAMLNGPPHRQIDSRQFRLIFDLAQPKELHADGAVVITETGEVKRVSTANDATLFFDPTTRRATNGILEGSVHYHDPKNDATGEKASFDLGQNHLFLTALPNSQPTITSDGDVVKGNLIEIDSKPKILKATGAVLAHLVPKKGGTAPTATSVFPGGNSPVFVNSDTLVMRQEDKSALFTGNVRAWQETNTLLAPTLQVESGGDLIEASGGVRTVLYNTRDRARKNVPTFASAETLTAHRKDSRIDLDGHVVVDDDQKTMTSDKASIFFGTDRKLEKVEANSHVVVVEKATNRKGTGDKALYLARQQMLYLTGSPALLNQPQGTVKGPQIVFDLSKNKVDVSGSGPSETTYNQQ